MALRPGPRRFSRFASWTVPQRVSTGSTSVQPEPDSPNTPSRKPAPDNRPGATQVGFRDRNCLGRSGGTARLRVREPPCRPGVQRILHRAGAAAATARAARRARPPSASSGSRLRNRRSRPPLTCSEAAARPCAFDTNAAPVSPGPPTARASAAAAPAPGRPRFLSRHVPPATGTSPARTSGPPSAHAWTLLPRPTRSAPPWPPSRRRPRRVASRLRGHQPSRTARTRSRNSSSAMAAASSGRSWMVPCPS
jgi:hypothetical protein